MKIRNLLCATTVALFLPFAGNALAEPGDRMGRMFEQLNLSAEQQQQIDSIKEQRKASSEGLRQQMQAAMEQMRSLQASNASADQLRQQHQQIQQLHQQMGNQRFEAMLEIREVLTTEQRAKLAELKPERNWQGRGGRGGRQAQQ
ncbi:MAG: Spy/CpxP family protein refolding chaperone [Limnoraphis sp. WC205]|jgi:protein CpxP|nr:Spy/CpxP family protein refolding chaperone [Limnoraphis sp. WC205]